MMIILGIFLGIPLLMAAIGFGAFILGIIAIGVITLGVGAICMGGILGICLGGCWIIVGVLIVKSIIKKRRD